MCPYEVNEPALEDFESISRSSRTLTLNGLSKNRYLINRRTVLSAYFTVTSSRARLASEKLIKDLTDQPHASVLSAKKYRQHSIRSQRKGWRLLD